MSRYNDGTEDKNNSTNRRGSVKNAGRLEAFESRARVGDADWGGCDSERLQTVIVKITALGGAVTLSLSRNQGAHALTLMLDDQRKTLWFNGDADLDEELDQVIALLDVMP